MSRGAYDDEIAAARGCICGGCDECLRAQGFSIDDEEVYCESCGDPLPYEERCEVEGEVICESCAAKAAVEEAGINGAEA